MTSGIYAIRNILNDFRYIGFAFDVDKRRVEHFWALRNKQHINRYLQNAWNKYGEINFEFYIIEEYPKNIELLKLMEIYFITYYNSFWKDEHGYNLTRGGDGNGKIMSRESREKMSVSQKERFITETHWNKGNHLSNEVKEKISKTMKETYKNNGHSITTGIHRTEDEKRKISIALMGNQNAKGKKYPDNFSETCSISRQGIRSQKNLTSKYLGCSKYKKDKNFTVRINYMGIKYYIGKFENEIDGAIAYDEKARELYGENARTNFPIGYTREMVEREDL